MRPVAKRRSGVLCRLFLVSLLVALLAAAVPSVSRAAPGGEVVIVLTRASQAQLIAVIAAYEARLREAGALNAGTSKALLPLRDGDQVVLLWADSAEPAVESERDLLTNSEVYELDSATPRDKGLSWTLGHTFPKACPPRLADAVLVAGRGVARWAGPRAVVFGPWRTRRTPAGSPSARHEPSWTDSVCRCTSGRWRRTPPAWPRHEGAPPASTPGTTSRRRCVACASR